MKALSLGLVLAILAFLAPARGQCETKLLSSDLGQGDRFGEAVALWGDTAIVGSPQDDDIADQSGAAYVFERNGSGWVQVQKLKASDAAFGDIFGTPVVLEGSTAVIGASWSDPQGVSAAGSVYVFEKVGGQWIETAKLWASDGTQNDFFGRALALEGDRLVVGVRDDNSVAAGSGSVYVFERIGGVWTETAKLIASDARSGDTLGTSVATWGGVIAAGAPGVDLPGAIDIGATYVFELGPGGWQEVAKLIPQDAQQEDFFGFSVAVNEHGILAGSTSHDAAAFAGGAVYFFDRDAFGWLEREKLLPADSRNLHRFGVSIAVENTTAVIGAIGDRDNGSGAGAAYVFRHVGGAWQQVAKLVPHNGPDGALFALSTALSGDTALFGAPHADFACPGDPFCGSGAAYVFDLTPTAVQYCSCQSLSPCGNTDGHGGCVNSTGRGAELSACGSGSVATDDLVLVASQLPPNRTALIYRGGKAVQAPFGDGQRCVGAGTVGRYLFQIRNSGPEGVITLGPGIAGLTQGLARAGRIDPGETWYFQCWFRDSQGPCGTRFNLSNGLAVTFGP